MSRHSSRPYVHDVGLRKWTFMLNKKSYSIVALVSIKHLQTRHTMNWVSKTRLSYLILVQQNQQISPSQSLKIRLHPRWSHNNLRPRSSGPESLKLLYIFENWFFLNKRTTNILLCPDWTWETSCRSQDSQSWTGAISSLKVLRQIMRMILLCLSDISINKFPIRCPATRYRPTKHDCLATIAGSLSTTTATEVNLWVEPALALTRILQKDLYSRNVRCSASSQESRWSNSSDIFLFLDMDGTRWVTCRFHW